MIRKTIAWQITFGVGEGTRHNVMLAVGDDVEEAVAILQEFIKEDASPSDNTAVGVEEVKRLGEVLCEDA